jgi:hypothetical protein
MLIEARTQVAAQVAVQVYQAKRYGQPRRNSSQKLTKKLRMVEEEGCTEESRGKDAKEDQKEWREEIARTLSRRPTCDANSK